MGIRDLIPEPIKAGLKRLDHLGLRYRCPFCGAHLRKFSPIGEDIPVLVEKHVVGGGRRNALCPACKSSDRSRLVYVYLRDFSTVFQKPELDVLHIAPERHLRDALRALPGVRYTAGDRFTEGYDYPDYVREVNVTRLPFDSDAYDLVICNHVLEHVEDDGAAMRELLRVLRPEGTAILQVPLSLDLATTHEDPSITDPDERERVFGHG